MTYIMEAADEGRRVERKTDRDLTLGQLGWAGLGLGGRALDLGCAAGTTCRIMADVVGDTGAVVGVDASTERLDEAARHPGHRRTIKYRPGDAGAVPAADGRATALSPNDS